MAEKLEIEVTGKSKYEVAAEMARLILVVIEKKEWGKITRKEYLEAVAEALWTLGGNSPK